MVPGADEGLSLYILVHEWFSGGGLAGRPLPRSLAREGAAMRDALLTDLAALREHRIVATADPRFPLSPEPAGVEVVTLRTRNDGVLEQLFASVDAAWLVAPETDGCLERLAAQAERLGTALLGPSASAIHRASDKAGLPGRLARCGAPHPETRSAASLEEARVAARDLAFPVVVKPARGAGCDGVSLVRNARQLGEAVTRARRADGNEPLLVQRYVPGVAASVSLLADGRRAVALTVNAQSVRPQRFFAYGGGATPLDHPLAERAAVVARRACGVFPGLKGYVGVDLVLTETEAVVIEVNPRLTTSYLGVRAALGANVAALALAACAGRLPARPAARRCVRFRASGRIFSDVSIPRPKAGA